MPVSAQPGTDGQADLAFTELAGAYLDDRAQRHPNLATDLGDHRFDAHLPEFSAAALDSERRAMDGWAARLAAIDAGELSPQNRVDAGLLANSVRRRVFELDELRETTWNPLAANPGRAIRAAAGQGLRPAACPARRGRRRLAEIPAMLAGARGLLGPMPRVHLETALGQFDGTIAMISRRDRRRAPVGARMRAAGRGGPARRARRARRAPRLAGRGAGPGQLAAAGRVRRSADRAPSGSPASCR